MDKIVLVPAYLGHELKSKTLKIPTGQLHADGELSSTIEETIWLETKYQSDCQVDSKRLSQDLSDVVAQLNKEGFEVVSIVPVTSGSHHASTVLDGGFGYGFSYTDSLIVHARLISR
ncbi:hypothetical protein [Psychromonas aquimarina]|uniref:hypothetical protein n=1 Tax=Psychromonas aquimarina TaxID=444919 RepID=UPI000425A71B|nr:hypothetical protein [Psychromonas aquimarina]